MSDVSCFLAVPHYGTIESSTAGALLTASRRFSPYINFEPGSLLAYVFNRLWCEALNMRMERPLTHFAMLHADMAPDPGWLDVLLDELDATGADVMSAVSPIKDQRGLTSTAWQDIETTCVDRLTMKQIHNLPPTFSAADGPKGKRLLVNTGCWVCKLGPWCEKFTGFHILDWIEKRKDGKFQPGVFSEDWNFSAWCAENGVKVMATRKVQLGHIGKSSYRNESAWGEWEEDYGDYHDPAEQIHGWMTRPELEWLRKATDGRWNVVEIGCWKGRSTFALCRDCQGIVHAIDHFQGSPGDKSGHLTNGIESSKVKTEFENNLKPFLDSGRCKLLAMDSHAAAEKFAYQSMDMVFIDGGHDYESARRDIKLWKPKLRPGGLLCGHDRDQPGVARAINELVPGWRAAAGSIWEVTV